MKSLWKQSTGILFSGCEKKSETNEEILTRFVETFAFITIQPNDFDYGLTIKCEQRIYIYPHPIVHRHRNSIATAPSSLARMRAWPKREIEIFAEWKATHGRNLMQSRFQNGFNDVVWHICSSSTFFFRSGTVIDGFLFNKNELRLFDPSKFKEDEREKKNNSFFSLSQSFIGTFRVYWMWHVHCMHAQVSRHMHAPLFMMI